MFQVTVYKMLYAAGIRFKARQEMVMMKLELPFAPFVGLTISNGAAATTASGFLKQVTWNTETKEFETYAEDEEHIAESLFDVRLQAHLQGGWSKG